MNDHRPPLFFSETTWTRNYSMVLATFTFKIQGKISTPQYNGKLLCTEEMRTWENETEFFEEFLQRKEVEGRSTAIAQTASSVYPELRPCAGVRRLAHCQRNQQLGSGTQV